MIGFGAASEREDDCVTWTRYYIRAAAIKPKLPCTLRLYYCSSGVKSSYACKQVSSRGRLPCFCTVQTHTLFDWRVLEFGLEKTQFDAAAENSKGYVSICMRWHWWFSTLRSFRQILMYSLTFDGEKTLLIYTRLFVARQSQGGYVSLYSRIIPSWLSALVATHSCVTSQAFELFLSFSQSTLDGRFGWIGVRIYSSSFYTIMQISCMLLLFLSRWCSCSFCISSSIVQITYYFWISWSLPPIRSYCSR